MYLILPFIKQNINYAEQLCAKGFLEVVPTRQLPWAMLGLVVSALQADPCNQLTTKPVTSALVQYSCSLFCTEHVLYIRFISRAYTWCCVQAWCLPNLSIIPQLSSIIGMQNMGTNNSRGQTSTHWPWVTLLTWDKHQHTGKTIPF